jgi:predicted transcriptional regulator
MKFILGSEQRHFPVFEGEELVGVLKSEALRQGRGGLRPDTPVSSLMRGEVPRIQSSENLKDALAEIQKAEAGVCAVYEGSRFLGLLDESRIRLALSFSHFLDPRANQ